MRLTGLRRYLANTSWLMAERFLRMTVALLVGVYVARYLGPDRYGVLNYALSFVGLFSVFAALGLNQIVIRDLVQAPQDLDRILGTAFLLRLEGAVAGCGLILLAGWLVSMDRVTLVMTAIIAGGLLFQSLNVIDLFFQSRVQSKFVVYAKVGQLGVSSILRVYGVLSGASLMFFVWVVLLDAIVLAAGLVVFYGRESRSVFRWRFDGATARNLLHQSWPLIISGFVIAIYMKIDQVMIKHMLGDAAVGRYAAAVRISEAWYFIPVVITSSVFPAIVAYKAHGGDLYERRLRQLYTLLVWLALVAAAAVSFLAGWIVNFLFGSAFDAAAGVLAIHMWAAVFVFIGVASARWLILEGLQLIATVNTVIGAAINIALNFVLIPSHGIEGAAIATVVSQAFAAYAGLLLWRSSRPNFFEITRALNPLSAI
jgi:O-antigen/teichoic acid export membrane protein